MCDPVASHISMVILILYHIPLLAFQKEYLLCFLCAQSTRTLTMKLRNNGIVVDHAGVLMLPSTENVWNTSAEMLFLSFS